VDSFFFGMCQSRETHKSKYNCEEHKGTQGVGSVVLELSDNTETDVDFNVFSDCHEGFCARSGDMSSSFFTGLFSTFSRIFS